MRNAPNRMNSVNSLLRQEISRIVLSKVNDPRLSDLTTITSVKGSKDLRYATVLVSVMGSPEERSKSIIALNSAAGFIHRQLRTNIDLRIVPKLRFILDDSYDQAIHIMEILGSINIQQDDGNDESL